jgi:YbbR domain-containing protein
MIASVLLSLMLWAAVYPSHIPAEKTRGLVAKVSYQDLPSNLIVTEMPDKINVYATGPMSRLATIDEDRLEFVVSLATAKPGRSRYVATVTPTAYAEFFPSTQSIPFVIDELVEKEMTITVEPQGQLGDPALAVDEYVPNPRSAVATGPKEQMAKLKTLRAAFDLRNFRIGDRTAQTSAIEPVLADGSVSDEITIQPKLAQVLPVISPAPISKPVNVLTQASVTVPEGYVTAGIETSPNTVTIRGSSRTVNSINQIATEPVTAQGITESKEFVVGLKVPRGVIVTGGVKTVKVKIIVNKIPEKTTPAPSP